MRTRYYWPKDGGKKKNQWMRIERPETDTHKCGKLGFNKAGIGGKVGGGH